LKDFGDRARCGKGAQYQLKVLGPTEICKPPCLLVKVDGLPQTSPGYKGMSEMRPETFARFDLHCVFNKLEYEVSEGDRGGPSQEVCLTLINKQGHAISCDAGVLEYLQREGYSERFGARPMQNAAMRVLGSAVASAMLNDGGSGLKGAVCYDRRKNKCFLRLSETSQHSTEKQEHRARTDGKGNLDSRWQSQPALRGERRIYVVSMAAIVAKVAREGADQVAKRVGYICYKYRRSVCQ
jgi:hypothetical protein